MTNRREFLQIGVAATALPFASRAAQAAGLEPGAGESVPLYAVVHDTRFEDSVAFARRSARLGCRTEAISGDMTRLWYDDLYHRWKRGPAAIAGLTAYGPLFCFGELARENGMHVVFRGEHRPAAARIEHAFSGPAAMLAEAVAVAESRGSFGATMADVVTQCPRGRNEITHARAASDGRLEPGGGGEALYSWVIAPAVNG